MNVVQTGLSGLVAMAAMAMMAKAPVALAQDAATSLAPVQVIGVTVLPGIGVPRNEIAAPVQSGTAADIERSGALDLSEYLSREFGAVHVNNIQGNPYQADISYRGFTASPLLGTPQGLSVYMDGVRMNQPFGDVVSWDLIPRNAIASVNLMPGSNPLFGLNTLGGALSIQTKDGRRYPGTQMSVSGGSWGRRMIDLTHGGSNEQGLNWFVAASQMKERGWRDDSPTDVRQLFGKLGWQDARTDLALSVAGADNRMNGNGMQEMRLLSQRHDSIYTRPDITGNRSLIWNLVGQHELNSKVVLSGNVYHRTIRSSTLNADINQGSLDQSVYQPSAADRAALAAAGYSGFPTSGASAANTPFPFWRCIAQALQRDEPGEKCNGLVNRTVSNQVQTGFSGQVSVLGTLAGHRNQLAIGVALDQARTRFGQSTQLGYLNPDRSVTGVDAYADGISGGNVDGEPFDLRAELEGRTLTRSVYFTDTLSIGRQLHLTLSGRYNRVSVSNRDQLNPGGGANSLDGDNVYSRFNPAVGASWQLNPALNLYAGYNEGSRAPTSIELGCANPDRPCKLPNAMAGDPPLKQVVTRTIELGLRGRASPATQWNLGLFRAQNEDDILFVADNQSGFGYFKNFGRTLRQGLEAGLSTRAGKWSAGVAYTLLDASYRSAETLNGSANSSNASAAGGQPGTDGTIGVSPGDRLPLIPRHQFKAHADYAMTPALSVGLGMVASSGTWARGNENNQHAADGLYYLGAGRTAGWAVFNASLRYQVTKQTAVFVQVANLFDRQYNTAAQLGPAGTTADGSYVARPLPANSSGAFPVVSSTFYAPGAPRAIWLGLRVSL